MIKFKPYLSGDFQGPVIITRKIDGICTFIKDGRAESKAGNKLFNFEDVLKDNPGLEGCFETYKNSWNDSISLVKNQSEDVGKVSIDDLYQLYPVHLRDSRLFIQRVVGLKESEILALMHQEVSAGYEGLVLYEEDTGISWKVKPVHTADVRVLSVVPGKGKHAGRLGAVNTKYGRVGTGFDDPQRIAFIADPSFIGSIIEVAYMHLTVNKKMRHARFIRPRPDKNTEDIL